MRWNAKIASSDNVSFIANTVYGISKSTSTRLETDPPKQSLRDIRLQTQRFGKDRDEQVTKASRALKAIEPARTMSAGVARGGVGEAQAGQ